MEPELQEFRSGKKSLELICYIAGAGAFGVFLRWMQLQLAFNELGLAEKSSFHAVLILFVVAAGVVFFRFVRGFEKARLYLPDSFSEAFSNPGRFYRIARIAAGLIVCAGSVLLYVQTGEDKHSGDYLVLSVLGLLSGIAFPLWLSLLQAQHHQQRDLVFRAGAFCHRVYDVRVLPPRRLGFRPSEMAALSLFLHALGVAVHPESCGQAGSRPADHIPRSCRGAHSLLLDHGHESAEGRGAAEEENKHRRIRNPLIFEAILPCPAGEDYKI